MNKEETTELEQCDCACECGGDCECHDHDEPCACEPNPDAKLAEMQDRYHRCLAEFDNYRKRTAKEMASRYNDGIRATCEKLLPIIDNFERAMASSDNKEDTFYQGIALIARQFDGVLTELGIEQISTQPGDPFDANLHHAVAHVEDENLGQNEVSDILQKGYIHKERVIRYAMVKVAN